MSRTIRVSLALLIALGAVALAAVGGATAEGFTPDKLIAAGWTCFQDPAAPSRTVCSDPGHGRPVPGDPNAPPSYNFKSSMDGSFIGTSHLIRADLYQGQPCPPRERPTSSFRRSVTTAASTSRLRGERGRSCGPSWCWSSPAASLCASTSGACVRGSSSDRHLRRRLRARPGPPPSCSIRPDRVGAGEVLVELAGGVRVGAFEQVPVAVGHVHGRVPDEVADRLQRDAGVVHERDERVAALVQADGLE